MALPQPATHPEPSPEPDQSAIRFQDAAVRLGGRTVWHDVTLEIGRGEFVAVLGPNGAGKSTLCRAILGLQPLAAGSATVLGEPVRRGSPQIGYVPQRRRFEPGLRVRGRDIVSLGLDGGHWGVTPPLATRYSARYRERRRRVEEVIELVGASEYADRVAGELSGGEQQRLLLAQALAGRPAVLLLDEPLDSLDPSNQRAVSELAGRIARTERVTVLLVAHDVNPLLDHLDRVLYLAGGRALIGDPRDVITSDTLTALYGSPIEVLRTRDGRVLVTGQPEAVSHHAGE
ncbi:MAG TPA: ATP-binding cassette domain-containing protein [Candidatus Binatia bacterium]|nr:ATP-binding cassette domain-containing protein [Candidatus Binatia bacterium]